MVDKSKKGKKGTISEGDMSAILQRYSMNTVLGLLQEVEQAAGEKIDWRELVKNSATGISSAREYQMLWRHIAYGEALIDQLENDAEPIDDDSDLEHEVEPFPALVGREASAEAAACVKVLIDSGYPNNSNPQNNSTIEAPLTINIPNCKAVSASSDGSLLPTITHGTNVSIAVSVPKLPLNSGVGEKRPINEVPEVNLPNRRRRRNWSLEDDMKLTASVQKHGERNWSNISRLDFDNDRKPNELSQRWSSLRKKQGNTKVGTSSQPSETQLAAAHRAMSLALDMPRGDNLKSAAHMNAAGIKIQHQPPKASASPAIQQLQTGGSVKPPTLANRPPMKPMSDRESMVKAAAVAAGARIATPSDVSSLTEAARSQNVVHITTAAGSSVMKPSTTSIGHQLPSNVHFIRNGLAKAPISTFSAPKPNISESRSTKPAALNPMGAAPVSNAAPFAPSTKPLGNLDDGVVSTSGNDNKEQGADPAEISGSAQVEKEPENRLAASCNKPEEGRNNQPSSPGKENAEGEKASISVSGDGTSLPTSEVEK